jgi:hypothetical protein
VPSAITGRAGARGYSVVPEDPRSNLESRHLLCRVHQHAGAPPVVGSLHRRGEVTRYLGRHGTTRVAKAVLVGAIPPPRCEVRGRVRRILPPRGLEVLHASVPAPRANAYAERWLGTVRRELLDRMLISGMLAAAGRAGRVRRSLQRPPAAPRLGAGTTTRARRTTCHPAGRKGCATGSTPWTDPSVCAGRMR